MTRKHGLILVSMILAPLAVASLVYLSIRVDGGAHKVCVAGVNYRERAISDFSVDQGPGCSGSVGGVPPGAVRAGGGGFSCGCALPAAKRIRVRWQDAQSLEEAGRGLPVATHDYTATVPAPESDDSRYVELHFLKDGRVVVDWRDTPRGSRVDPETGRIRTGSGAR